MKRVAIVFITLLILALITVAGLEWMARIEDKHPGSIKFSSSANESIKNNFFVANYQPLQNNLKLTQHPYTIHFDSIFAERGWRIDTSGFYLLSKKIPAEVYNVLINYSGLPDTLGLYFDLVPANDSSSNAGLIHYGNHLMLYQPERLQDTLWFNVREKTNDSIASWIETAGEIGFVIKK